ncbi:hypothetical protein [Streptomyces sp. Ru87]|uniref:hypothetical protein n=1 Tax=Streptomyces sp. Ru87 TaxID=2044307 RepID=UPI0015D48730|nr:hypothetical protein [Streptomyces sp. Ru87]
MRMRLTVVDSTGEAVTVYLDTGPESAVTGPGGSAAPAELRVVGGPGAGAVHRLAPGDHRLGTAADGSPRVGAPRPAVPAALLRVAADGRCVLLPEPDGTPLGLDRAPVTGETPWPPGAQLTMAGSLLELAAPQRPDAAVRPSADGMGLDYHRPPRLPPAEPETWFRLPVPPAEPAKRPLPYVAALLPLPVALTGVFVLGTPYALLLGLPVPPAVLRHHLAVRRQRAAHAAASAAHVEAWDAVERAAENARAARRSARLARFPDPAAVLLTAVGPRRALWERRSGDADFLTLRVGTADQPSGVVVEDPAEPGHHAAAGPDAYDMPVTVELRRHKVLGLAGTARHARAVAHWAVGQAAVLHSPRDLRIHVLAASGGTAAADWAWTRTLPHAHPRGRASPGAHPDPYAPPPHASLPNPNPNPHPHPNPNPHLLPWSDAPAPPRPDPSGPASAHLDPSAPPQHDPSTYPRHDPYVSRDRDPYASPGPEPYVSRDRDPYASPGPEPYVSRDRDPYAPSGPDSDACPDRDPYTFPGHVPPAGTASEPGHDDPYAGHSSGARPGHRDPYRGRPPSDPGPYPGRPGSQLSPYGRAPSDPGLRAAGARDAGPGAGDPVAADADSWARRLAELAVLITARRTAADRGARDGRRHRGPDVLVVLDGARRLRALPGAGRVLREGPAVGVHTLCLEADERLLPDECLALVVAEPGGTLRVARSGSATLTGVRPDAVTADWCGSVGRALSPLRDAGEERAGDSG